MTHLISPENSQLLSLVGAQDATSAGVDVRQLLVHFLPGDFAVHGKQLNEFMNEEHLHCPHPMAPLAGQASQWMSAEQAAEILGGTSPNYYHCIGS